ncbi:MAG: pyrroline-5-carboxylate reductase [Oscillospiraceae bacterium]|nr:pyrroline-5-carboxylate reductase [Oscillospiraceae bacterium]
MKTTLGFIGVGNMARSIIKAIISSDVLCNKVKIVCYDKIDISEYFKDIDNVVVCKDAQQVIDISTYVFLCVKPQNLDELLTSVRITYDKVIVSICAGISAEYIKQRSGASSRVILVMPNTPLMLGEGASALAKCDGVSDEEFDFILSVFSACGVAREISEDKMKEIIAVNGSSPAFIYLFAKAFSDYAKSVGIEEKTAIDLFSQSLIGSAKMITDSGYTIDELIKMVSSPGGTTLAGLSKLYDGNFLGVVDECCKACTNRAYELSKQ